MLDKWLSTILVIAFGLALAYITVTWQQPDAEISLIALKLSGWVWWFIALSLTLKARK